MFEELRLFSYRWIAEYKDTASAGEWQSFVMSQAGKMNPVRNPMHHSEVRAIARSVSKWCWNRFDIAASDKRFSKLQAYRGKLGGTASGVSRLDKTEDKRASARLMKAQGQSQRAIALTLGVDRTTIQAWCKNPE